MANVEIASLFLRRFRRVSIKLLVTGNVVHTPCPPHTFPFSPTIFSWHSASLAVFATESAKSSALSGASVGVSVDGSFGELEGDEVGDVVGGGEGGALAPLLPVPCRPPFEDVLVAGDAFAPEAEPDFELLVEEEPAFELLPLPLLAVELLEELALAGDPLEALPLDRECAPSKESAALFLPDTTCDIARAVSRKRLNNSLGFRLLVSIECIDPGVPPSMNLVVREKSLIGWAAARLRRHTSSRISCFASAILRKNPNASAVKRRSRYGQYMAAGVLF